MTKVIVNLTLPIVQEAIESILELYPQHPYREFFACPDARQDLVAYVLSRFPNSYTAVDDFYSELASYNTPFCSQEQRLRLETLIHQGIRYFTHERAEAIRTHTPELVELNCVPSTWFG